MGLERTSVGLDVHARSVSAAAIDGRTGELFKQRLVPDQRVVLDWVRGLPGPVAVTYEAGPTGFGLARALAAAGIRCEVAAPSKISRPSGDRIKTDARDALLLARLLRLDDIVAVRVPTVTQEAARDLVRAREDVRVDLMRVRHRISKLLLRHGYVYYGGKAWTGKHEHWLDQIRFDGPGRTGTQAAYDADREALTLAVLRRRRLDEQITALAADSEFTPVTRRRAACAGSPRSPGSPSPWRSATGIGSPAPASAPTSDSFPASTPRGSPATNSGSPRPATPTSAGCWSRPPGTTSPATASARPCAPAGPRHPRPRKPAGTPATSACTTAGPSWPRARRPTPWPAWPSPANWPAGAGRWPPCPTPAADRPGLLPPRQTPGAVLAGVKANALRVAYGQP
jgi:transposase